MGPVTKCFAIPRGVLLGLLKSNLPRFETVTRSKRQPGELGRLPGSCDQNALTRSLSRWALARGSGDVASWGDAGPSRTLSDTRGPLVTARLEGSRETCRTYARMSPSLASSVMRSDRKRQQSSSNAVKRDVQQGSVFWKCLVCDLCEEHAVISVLVLED